MGKEKVNINIVVIGHVDSGKSTTIGHLIYKLGRIDNHVTEKPEKEAAEMNQNSFNYAGVAELGHDISINNCMWELQTDEYHFTFIHAHRQPESIKNMIRGASGPNCALLVVDSTSSTGGFEVGTFKNGQTPEHALIKPLNVICCCNKMDEADYSKERYDEIMKSTSPYLKNLGFDPAKTPFVPISGLEGDNLIERSKNLPWYEGPTLLEALHQIQGPTRPSDKGLGKEYPNGGKSIKSAIMKRGKKFGAATRNGGKKFGAAMVTGGKKSWAAIVEGCKKLGPPCLNACVVGGVQVAVALAT